MTCGWSRQRNQNSRQSASKRPNAGQSWNCNTFPDKDHYIICIFMNYSALISFVTASRNQQIYLTNSKVVNRRNPTKRRPRLNVEITYTPEIRPKDKARYDTHANKKRNIKISSQRRLHRLPFPFLRTNPKPPDIS